jgi:hypothetical protein
MARLEHDETRRGPGRWLLATALIVAGCAAPPEEKPAPPAPPLLLPPPPPPRSPQIPPPPAPAVQLRDLPPAPKQPTRPAPPAPRLGQPRVAMAVRAIDLEMRCAAMDQRHHAVQADIELRDGEVRYLRARLTQPGGASCDFALPEFRQTRRLPAIELTGRASACTLNVWEQGPQVFLSYRDCERHCTPAAAFAKVLPTIFDRRVGRCD